MQQHKISQGKIYFLLFSIFLISSIGCQQKPTKEGLNLSANIESLKTSSPINKKSSKKEKPAVIYRSNDLGQTWSPFAKGIPEDATLSGIKEEANKVYVTTDYHGVFVASNGQNDWTSLNIGFLKDLDINCIEVEANKLILGTLRNGVLVSKDGGINWEQPQRNILNTPIRAFIKSGNKLFAGTDSGIFESLDMGDTWSLVFGEMQILGFTSLNDKVYAATQHGALMCIGNSENWNSIYLGDALHDISNDGKYIYAMTLGQELLKTQNDGASWEIAQSGITRPENFYTNELRYIENDIFSAQWIGIYHSSDHGNNWRILNGLPDSTAFSTLEITDFGILAGVSIR